MRRFFFRYRGFLFIPAGIVMLALGKPTLYSMVLGFFISLILGEGLRIWAVGYTGVTTRAKEVEAPHLITAGPYAYVRNPLYLGNLISWVGFCIATTGESCIWEKVLIFGMVFFSYGVIYGNIIPHEEDFLKTRFGGEYEEYSKDVPRLFPRLKAYKRKYGKYDPDVIWKAEVHTFGMLILVVVLVVGKYWWVHHGGGGY